MPAGESLVLVARRFPALLRVDLGFFSSRKEVCRAWERGAASIDARLELLGALTRAGVEVGVRLGPLIPSANDDASDWADLFASLARLGVREVVPTWLEPSRRLLAQIRREISPETARHLESFTHSSDDMLAQGWRVATLNMMRHMASPLGIDVKRCRCGPDTAGASPCLLGPAETQKDRQLALFG
jgi:DNA repair photolyase